MVDETVAESLSHGNLGCLDACIGALMENWMDDVAFTTNLHHGPILTSTYSNLPNPGSHGEARESGKIVGENCHVKDSVVIDFDQNSELNLGCIGISSTLQIQEWLRFILILQHNVLPSTGEDLYLTYLYPQLTRCLSALRIPLAACLPSTHTVT